MQELFQIDWRIFMTGTRAWLDGGNPYGALSPEFSAGAFAYPPTALPVLALFLPFGWLGYYIWTALQLIGLWWLTRDQPRSRFFLLAWSPLLLHLIEGQSTLPVVLVVWAAYRARTRGFLWGLALALAMTKPQVALLPVLWLLWQDRRSPLLWRIVGGMLLGTLLLALPTLLRDPAIWSQWIVSLGSYRDRVLQMAAWQGFGLVILLPAGYLWYRSRYGGWQWWLAAALFPQTAHYAIVPLIPVLRPRQSRWTLVGLGLAGILQGPALPITLPLILAGHMLAAWMIGGVRQPDARTDGERAHQDRVDVEGAVGAGVYSAAR